MQTLQKVDILSLDVSIWTAWKRLRPEDLKLGDGAELPPEEVAHLGSKRVMDPERLHPFLKLKKQMERACEAIGIRFLGGYAIPRDKTADLSKVLDRIAAEFEAEKRDFLAEYDKAVEEWVAKHPRFEDALRRAIEPVSAIGNRLGASFSIYRIAPAEDSGSLDREVLRMGNKLLDEVAREANETYEKSVAVRTEKNVSKRIAAPLRRIRDKLDGLSFLDGAVLPMVAAIDELLASFPAEGKVVEGALYHEIVAMILILSDPEKMRKHAATRAASPGPADLFSSDEDEEGQLDFGGAFTADEDPAAGPVPVAAAQVEEGRPASKAGSDFSIFDGLFGDAEEAPADAPAAAEEHGSAVIADPVQPVAETSADAAPPAAQATAEPVTLLREEEAPAGGSPEAAPAVDPAPEADEAPVEEEDDKDAEDLPAAAMPELGEPARSVPRVKPQVLVENCFF